ncbi:MFS transporter [Pseudarthrobacter raffinosi]|uniref:MFS transporter n=1 Tax=Pseudarthrobacter raffinosi TaxID=2953651 RepID=UPI00208F3BE3|nr:MULTISPECIES: MFS transporter [unclassified Pseudarthrobacter]MCO4237256.1 MFS transporter [Pseudarthrobacter sp. MDT3-28]MCO4252774.1 MFS transporter [Pseudarthrobacter sp. MDT3-9]
MPRSNALNNTRGPSPSAITAVLALSGTVVALMQTLVVPLLPDFPRILDITADDASWLVTATLLASAVATPIVSRSADMYGKRKMMVVCLAIMVAGSVIAAVGGSFLWLVIGRTLQGFASALIPVGISIMRDELPKEKMGSAVALMSATLGIGSAMGLPLAGVLYESLGWASIFWVSAAAGALLLVAVALVVPESKVRTPGRFDYAGALVLSAALAALLLAISKGGAWGWGSEPVLLLFLTAAILLAAWVPYELKVSQPMVDLRTSGRRPVLMTNVASLLVGFAMFANMLLTTQQLQLPTATGYGFGLNVITAGLCMVPSGLAMVIFAPVSGRIIRVFGGKSALIAGAVVMIVGYVSRVFFYDSIAWVIIGSTVVSVGTAIAYAAMPTLIMGVVPITETASANGLNSLVRSIGTSTSSAAVAAVLTSVSMTVGAVQRPSFDAFKDVFWLAALAAAASVVATVFIPKATAARRPSAADTAASVNTAEIVVQGRVLAPDNRPVTPAVVTVLQTAGEPVDWSRVDTEGNYSVALPGAGKYLMVTNAAGWAPMAEVFDFDGRTRHQNFLLRDRLEISGLVTAGSAAVAGAVVTLLEASGGYVHTTLSDDDGAYAFPLPLAGRYVVSMVDPATHQAMARKLAVDNRSVTVHLAAPRVEEKSMEPVGA